MSDNNTPVSSARDFAGWMQADLDDMAEEGARHGLTEGTVMFIILKRVVMTLGPMALPQILETLQEYKAYSDKELAILARAERDVIASED